MKNFRSEIKRKVTGTFSLNIIGMVLSFLVSVLIARQLGPEGYGEYSYVITWLFILNLPATMGLKSLIVRDIASNQSKQDWGSISGLLAWSNKTVLATSTAIALIFGAITVALYFIGERDGQLLPTIFISLFLLPVIALTTLRQAAMQGFHYVVLGQICDSFIQPISFVALLTFSYLFLPDVISARWVMLFKLISCSIALLIGAFMLYRVIPHEVKVAKSEFQVNSWLRSSFFLLLLTGSSTIFNQSDRLMLGMLDGVESVGIYTIASRGVQYVLLAQVIGSSVLGPSISSLYTQRKIEELQKITTKSARLIGLSSLIVSLMLIIFGKQFLSIFGESFIQGYTVLVILCAGKVINAFSGLVGLLLNMTNHEKDTAFVNISCAFTNVALNYYLIPLYGAEGAAFSTSLTVAICNIWLVYLVYKRIGIHSTALGKIG